MLFLAFQHITSYIIHLTSYIFKKKTLQMSFEMWLLFIIIKDKGGHAAAVVPFCI